jgi:hypothetical protein
MGRYLKKIKKEIMIYGANKPKIVSNSMSVNNEKKIIIFIFQYSPKLQNVYEFSYKFLSWKRLNISTETLPIFNRINSECVYFNKKVYIFGGCRKIEFQNMLIYDMIKNKFEPLIADGETPEGTFHKPHKGFVFKKNMYIISKNTKKKEYFLHSFSFKYNQWSEVKTSGLKKNLKKGIFILCFYFKKNF